MMAILVGGVLVVSRAPLGKRLALAGALLAPVQTAALLLVISAAQRFREARDREVDPGVAIVLAAAGDLRAGEPLRTVLAAGRFGDQVAAWAVSGGSFRSLPPVAFSAFGADARLVAATVTLAAEEGGPVAPLFESLAHLMLEASRTRRERRAAMAPAIAQATVVGGIPSAALVWQAASGDVIGRIASGGLSAAVMVGGAGLTLLGVTAIVRMVRRTVR